MDIYTELLNGLGNLAPEQRRKIYTDLRAALNLSETEPMIPLPAPDLATWSRRAAEIMAEVFAQRPGTRLLGNAAMLEAGILEYGKPPTDAFLDTPRWRRPRATRAWSCPTPPPQVGNLPPAIDDSPESGAAAQTPGVAASRPSDADGWPARRFPGIVKRERAHITASTTPVKIVISVPYDAVLTVRDQRRAASNVAPPVKVLHRG